MAKAVATLKVDENGRCTIPHSAREKLGIDGEQAHLLADLELEEVADV